MELLDQLGFAMLDLLFDAPAPLSVVFPEARLFRPGTRSVSALRVGHWLLTAAQNGWIDLELEDDGAYRNATDDDVLNVMSEYAAGRRNADEVRQIFGAPDIWLKISDEGKRRTKEVWDKMPPHA